MPAEDSLARARQSMWYSFNYGQVHFVSVNTETDWPGAEEENTGDSHDKFLPAGHFGENGEYLKWLEADLAAAHASRKATGFPRFIVAGGHRPYGDVQPLHTDLFSKYAVNLYVAGHGHSYSRGAPVNGTTYIMVGGAGCDEMAPPPGVFGTTSQHNLNASSSNDSELLAEVEFTPSADQVLRQGNAHAPGYAVPLGAELVTSGRYATGVLTVNASGLHWSLIDSIKGTVLDEVQVAS